MGKGTWGKIDKVNNGFEVGTIFFGLRRVQKDETYWDPTNIG